MEGKDRAWWRFREDSTFSIVTASVATFAASVLLSFGYKALEEFLAAKQRPWKKVPGALPFLGHLLQIGKSKDLVLALEEWCREYSSDTGCFEMELPCQPLLVVCREDRFLEINKQRPFHVIRSPMETDPANSIGALGVFSAEGDAWKQDRKVFAPALNHKNVRDFVGHIQKVMKRLIGKWEEIGANNKPVIVNKDFYSFTIDIISLVAYGVDANTLESPNSDDTVKDIVAVMDGVVNRGYFPIPFYKISFIGQYLDGVGFVADRLKRNFRSLVENMSKTDDKALDAAQRGTFLGKLVKLNKENHSHLTDDRLIGQLLTMYLGATDSMSSALNTLVWQLCEDDTGLQVELAEECLALPEVTLESLTNELPRTRSFLYEVLRVYQPFPFLTVMTDEDLPFADTTLPRGTEVLLMFRYVNVHPTHPPADLPVGPTGAGAVDLDARRWLADVGNGKVEFQGPSRTSPVFLTFGLGARSCPGRLLAEAELLLCLHSLLCKFDMRLKPGHRKVGRLCKFSDDVDCDLEIVLRPRKSS